ncbi:MAG TPA: hypothetical protein VIL18_01115 [Longimicrobiales bacterium]
MEPLEAARKLASAMERLLGGRLRSLLVHGSVARGEAVEGVSDVNVLALVDRIDAATLKSLSPLARRWAGAGNTPPLLMAWAEWHRAADAFAIELADMKDAHVVVHGEDPLVALDVDPVALRLQAENELRGKLLQLREGLLLAGEDSAQVGRLLLAALPSFTTYARAALRLAGRPVPRTTPEAIEAAAELIGAVPRPLLHVWNARARKESLALALDDPLVVGYHEFAERTAAFVDALHGEAE